MRYKNRNKTKYGNKKTAEGDSGLERRRKKILIEAEKQGIIQDLIFQPRFKILDTPKNSFYGIKKDGSYKKGRDRFYTPDFHYTKNCVQIFEDTKGVKTDSYTLRRDLFISLYCADPGIVFREIYKKDVYSI